jgi:glycyl-tRNA synthetase alpha subunit
MDSKIQEIEAVYPMIQRKHYEKPKTLTIRFTNDEYEINTVRPVGAAWLVKFESFVDGEEVVQFGTAHSVSAANARIRSQFRRVKILESEVTTDIQVAA